MADFFDIRDKSQFGKIDVVSSAGAQIGPITEAGVYQISSEDGIVFIRHKSSSGANTVTSDTGLLLFPGAIEVNLNVGDYIGAIAKSGHSATVRVYKIG